MNKKGYLIHEHTILMIVVVSTSLVFGNIVVNKVQANLISAFDRLDKQTLYLRR